MARIGNMRIPMTFDTGAQIPLVPIELVKPEEFTGEVPSSRGSWRKSRGRKGKWHWLLLQWGQKCSTPELWHCLGMDHGPQRERSRQRHDEKDGQAHRGEGQSIYHLTCRKAKYKVQCLLVRGR